MIDDKRIDRILKQIEDFTARGSESLKVDSEIHRELKDIAVSLNQLGIDLKAKNARVNSLIEIMLKYTVMDFSEKAVVSDKRDEIDALATGLNALAEETQYAIEVQTSLREETESKAIQLEASNKELESFTYSVSHDLRTPLRAIHGYSQVLLEDCHDKLDEDCRRALHAVMHNAKKMGKLIDNLLTFSRLGRKEISKSKLDTNDLVRSVISQFEEAKNPQTEIIIHPMPPIHADWTLMGLVYQNLFSNAFKYSSKNASTRIEIGITDTDRGEAFYVKDNGVGFDMEYYDKLFGVFQRLHGDDEFEGTGVGLPIVQRIINRHGGSVWAEGVVNGGATLYFTLDNKKDSNG
ncbi:MAG: ATP-binding protein [Balneolales bacterium]